MHVINVKVAVFLDSIFFFYLKWDSSLPYFVLIKICLRFVQFKKDMQALQFPRGNIYQIVCKEGNQALRIQTNNPNEYNKARIVGVPPNAHDPGQLFMVQKVGHGDDEFELVNCQSNFVWDEESGQIRLKFGKQSGDQLFKVDRIENGFWFKTSSKGDVAVALEGILRYKKFDPNAINQIFYIVPVQNSNCLNQTCVLVNAYSGKALDVPGATFEHGQRLIQYEKNKRFNQRWRWVQSGQGYLLQSVLNNHCIDIAEEKKEPQSKVVQWDKTGGRNQLWRPVPNGQGVWKIQSIHAPGQFLTIHNDTVEDGGKLEINNNNGPTQNWRIQGYVPK